MNRKLLLFTSLSLVFSACSFDESRIALSGTENGIPSVNEHNVADCYPGVLAVQLSDEPESLEAVASLLSQMIDVKSVRPIFPDDPRYIERHRAAGLNRWFAVQYDGGESLTRASSDLSLLPGVELVEGMPVLHSTAFNDPMLNRQWHYINTAQQSKYVAGCDINLHEAWEYGTGSPEVIVAVLDGGVRYTHEELKDNMWVNEAELNGVTGKDDDGNGYVDDIYGYNFCYVESYSKMHGTIEFDDHGTHTSGTIAAKNNNGKGGCGIAGGNGNHGGVRIMSCQIIQQIDKDNGYPSDAGAAFVYAADNGAIISNNSWSGGNSTYIRNAIKYFNDYAGCDKNGNQLPNSLMKGGVAFFAAGNENTTSAYPAMYDEAYAVASIGPDFKRAYYSNYGTWVDITAPGGDQVAHGYYNGGVYSPVAGNDSSYDYYQGTSMACPHVTGVAALAVSFFGGQGFTRADLISKLEDAANPVIYDYNPNYRGQLGIGLVDAGAMFDYKRPSPVEDLKAEVSKNTVTLSWTVPSADEGHTISSFEITKDNETLAYDTPSVKTGEVLRYTFEGLEFETSYTFTIRSVNNEGVKSKLSSSVIVVTEANKAPVITPVDGLVVILGRNETKTLKFSVNDAEGDDWDFELRGRTAGLDSRKIDNNAVEISFDGAGIFSGTGVGTYGLTLSVADVSGNGTSVDLKYTVLNHYAPKLKQPVEDIIISGIGNRVYLTLSDYFESDAAVTVFVETENEIASWIEENGVVRFTSRKAGETDVTLKIVDRYNESAESSFKLVVTANGAKAEIYPTSTASVFYVRPAATQDIKVRIVSQSGQTLLNRIYPDAGPSSPAAVTIPASCPAGVYTAVAVMADGSQVKQTIVKL